MRMLKVACTMIPAALLAGCVTAADDEIVGSGEEDKVATSPTVNEANATTRLDRRGCVTQELSVVERAAVEDFLEARRGLSFAKGGPPPSGVAINVYFHVITSGADGHVTQTQIEQQLKVL